MLTKRQKQFLDYITQFIKKNGYAPSVEETKKHFRLASKASAHQQIEALSKKGYLTKENYTARGISIIKDAPLSPADDYFPFFYEYEDASDVKRDTIDKFLNKIICADGVATMRTMPSESIDIAITSPPYDALRTYNGNNKFDLHNTGKELFRVLKNGGVVAMVIQDQTKNFGKSLTSFKTIIDWCDNIGFKLFECLIYKKYGAEGAWWNKRFRVDHEYIPVFLKGERPQYFNKETLKIPSKHAGKTMTGGGTRLTNGIRIPTRSITINPKKCRGTVWEYLTAGDGSRLKHQHPATFPNQLPYDFINCFCPENGIVLDPFLGSGTTAVAAKNLKRKFIGIDICKDYCAIAEKRLAVETENTLF
ncbi:site-specific DNA-methyltransferase [bacterium (Candidatus Gribaldobacteria) CG10_big_fil_rev_8_21_14_0_10_37_21]|uniref:Methyltransferase n=1 Tax=bacterium (Candidatus Gribaldobacteria) CG10_big_fil_rev_8_21_14_0_10_37_21 TaxID=2014275 RepID=A0A2H0UUM6_9BACT|nr:MAG: site-specific DNA-methyltransferase [bacterium (Candidatus Gribaldobacteria) CG10_big_fil_rev_8_21_14_0_10_37_21]